MSTGYDIYDSASLARNVPPDNGITRMTPRTEKGRIMKGR